MTYSNRISSTCYQLPGFFVFFPELTVFVLAFCLKQTSRILATNTEGPPKTANWKQLRPTGLKVPLLPLSRWSGGVYSGKSMINLCYIGAPSPKIAVKIRFRHLELMRTPISRQSLRVSRIWTLRSRGSVGSGGGSGGPTSRGSFFQLFFIQ